MPKIYNRYNKSCFKESNSKKAEASGVLIGYKITDKYKKHQKIVKSDEDIPKEIYVLYIYIYIYIYIYMIIT